jgi:DNA sulfur modification protein DndD
MMLRYLIVTDFRQFYGEQRIDFAEGQQRNVTVIYGHNGAGKTTLLNAFTWALFDATTPAFENPRAIANERALHELANGHSLEVCARVCFEHNNRVYDVKRSKRVTRDGDGRLADGVPWYTVTVTTPGQEPERHENVTEIIGQILPRDLYNFFFFDGERIEQIVKESESKHLEDAVKIVLGLEVLEKALKHVGPAKKILKGKLERYGKGSAVELLLQESSGLEAKIAEKVEARELCAANRRANEALRTAIDDALRVHDASREKQALLDTLESQEKELIRSLADKQVEARKLISRDGFTAFCSELAKEAGLVAEDLRTKGQLPAAYQRQFVQDLLQAGICICGTSIAESNECRARVERLVDAGGRHDIESGLTGVSSYVGQYVSTRERLHDGLSKVVADRSADETTLMTVRERASEERRKLSGAPNIDVARYASERAEHQRKIDEDGASHRILSDEIVKLEAEHEQLEKKISAAEVNDEKAHGLQLQIDSANRIEKAIREVLQIRRSRARQQLDERIKKIYSTIAYKDYSPELTDDFALKLHKSIGGVKQGVAKSTGENQLLSLSFVSALAQVAKERYDERERGDTLSAYEGGIYPIVMDSPFGTLDETPRRDVAYAIPKLAPQVVLLVSKAQGLGAVHEQLSPHIGKSYVIVYQSSRADVEQEFIDIDGHQQQYTAYSGDGFEGAVLQEIKTT